MTRAPHPNRAKILEAMPGTAEQISDKTGVPLRTVRNWLKILRTSDPKPCYIGGWKHVNGASKPSAIYKVGNRKDTVYRARTQAERWAKYFKKEGIREQRRLRHISDYKKKKVSTALQGNPFAQLFVDIDRRRKNAD